MANKKGLGIMLVGKVRTITRPGTLVLLERCLFISEANECLTSAT